MLLFDGEMVYEVSCFEKWYVNVWVVYLWIFGWWLIDWIKEGVIMIRENSDDINVVW